MINEGADLGINQGMIFENMVAQMLRANGHELYFHEFEYCPEKNRASKQYEVDFLTVRGRRLSPIEVIRIQEPQILRLFQTEISIENE